MEKLNRKIDPSRIELAKINTIDNVMDRINSEKTFLSFFKPIKAKFALMVFSVLLLVAVIFATNLTNPPTPPTLTEFQTKKLVETSYMSASIISNVVVNTTTPLSFTEFMPLAESETEFEKNIDDFNSYFNMLKVFIDDQSFLDNAIFETLEDSDYDYKISYLVEGKEYIFLLTFSKTGAITGEITIGDKVLLVEGDYKETENSYELELIARRNNDYIEIEYQSETEDEIEKSYHIKQFINGIESEKEISIKSSDEEVTVEISQGEDSYSLEKYSENGVTVYFLEYEVNNLEGEVYITETVDEFGKTIYRYHISEGEIEKDIDLDDPDEEDEDDDEDGEDEDEDDDDDDENDELLVLSSNLINII
jgi:hypothetical protein